MMRSQCNTCSMVIYLTIQYQGECGHIEGHAYSVLFVHNETCVLGFHIYINTSLIIASCTPENIISKYSKTSEYIEHACRHIWGRAFASSREVAYTKTN